MKRPTSTALLAVLGLTLAHGCSSNSDDDPPFSGSTTGGTTTTTAGTGAASSSASGDGSVTSGSSTTGNDTSGSGGNGGGSSSSGGTSLDEACPQLADECGTSNLQAQSKEINMLIVLDKSGSMDKLAGGDRKWDAMRDALSAAIRDDSAQNIEFGLWLYPFPEFDDEPIQLDCGPAGNCCEMPGGSDPQVAIGEGNDQVEVVLDATEPGGGTPTAVALERALQYFTSGPGGNLSGEKYVLLATDGGPNCNPGLECGANVCTANLDGTVCSDAPDGNCCDASYAGNGSSCLDDNNVVDQIEALRDEGIDTFVVGIPGSEDYSSYLDDFAEAGGRAVSGDYSYYRVDDVNDLAQTFQEITVQLVTSCELQFDDAPMDQPQVAIDCEIVDRFETGGGQAGAGSTSDTENWNWNGDSGTVTLLGDTCDMVAAGVGRVDVLFNCPDIR